MKNKWTVCWSGGKDSALSLHLARQAGLGVSCLLNMSQPGGKTRAHRLPKDILQAQADLLGLPLVQGITDWVHYEQDFRCELRNLKQEKGVEGCVFGDIYLEEHRRWNERVCKEEGMFSFYPLWGEEERNLLTDFFELGFQAVVVAVNTEYVDEGYLGTMLGWELANELEEKGCSLAGEKGEYHTVVVNGPHFPKRIDIQVDGIVREGKYSFLDIKRFSLECK